MHSSIKTLLRPAVRPIKVALRPILYSRRPPLCDNVVQRCLDWNYPVKRIHEPFLVEFPIPRGSETDPTAAPLFDVHSKIGLPAQFLVCLPNGGVPGSAGLLAWRFCAARVVLRTRRTIRRRMRFIREESSGRNGKYVMYAFGRRL